MEQSKVKNILWVYFALNIVEAVISGGYILTMPADPKNQVLFGYSLPRLIILVGFVLVVLILTFTAYKIYLNTALFIRFLEKVFTHRSRLWVAFSLVNGLVLIGLLFCFSRPSSIRDFEALYAYFPFKPLMAFITLEGYYDRVLPTVIWVVVVSIQTAVVLLFLYLNQFKQAIQADFTRERPRILLTLTTLAALSILAVGLSRAVPFILEPDKDLALHLVQNDIVENIHRYLWILAIYFNLILAWLLSWKLHGQAVSAWDYTRYFLPLLIALLFSYYCLTVIGTGKFWDIDKSSNWNVFYITQDSGGYVQKYSNNSIRPPVYPLFIQLLTAGTGFNHTLEEYQLKRTIKDVHDPLMRVVRAQKIILLTCSLFACTALMGLLSSTLPAIFFLWLYEYGFFSPEISQIMSEPIAQAWLFLILASFFAFSWKRWKFLLPLSGFFCAGLYMTRPAGIYGGVLLAAIFLWALYHGWRSYWLPCLIAVLLTAALVASPILYTYFTVGNLFPTPMYALAKIAFALQVAEPEDINLMPDEEAHRFLIKALEIKRVEDAKIEAVVPQGTHPYFTQVTANLYIVSTLAINDVLPGGSPTDKINLLARVSTPLLAHHRFEYYKLALNSFWYATTRLSIYYFSGIITVCLVLALLLRGWAGFSAIALILTHLTHLWIVSLFDIPILRYIWATQFLILLSLFILLWSIINTWARNISENKQEINK
jgi:hypothetical protein